MSQAAELKQIVDTIKKVLPADRSLIGLHEPYFGGNELEYVKECLDTGWVSSVGKFVDRFEALLADMTGVRRAVAVVNGTAALHICLKLAGVEPADEVLSPALTFIATTNAIAYCNAVPHFVDSDMSTLGVDPAKLSDYLGEIAEIRHGDCYNRVTGRRIKAILPMHTFGHPVDLDALQQVCEEYCLTLVEDAAESLGSYYKGRHTGNWGKVAALSFNGNKVVTTGGGGAILTNDEEIGKFAKHITTTAKLPHKWDFFHDQTGYNYRLPNINAALGCAQLEQLPRFIAQKRSLAERYREAFTGVAGAWFFTEPDFAESNYWLNAILLDDALESSRDELLQLSHDQGILVRPAWILMHKLPMFKACPKSDLTVAEKLERKIVNLPSSVFL